MRLDPVLIRAIGLPFLLACLLFGGISADLANGAWAEWLHDLMLNLAVTALGVIVTVLLVDKLVQEREDSRWAGVRKHGHNQLRMVAIRTVNLFNTALSQPSLATNRSVHLGQDVQSFVDEVWSEWLRAIEDRLTPALPGLGEIGPDRMAMLASGLNEVAQDADRIAQSFQGRFDASLTEQLFELHTSISTASQMIPVYWMAHASADLSRKSGINPHPTAQDGAAKIMETTAKNCIVRAARLLRELPIEVQEWKNPGADGKSPAETRTETLAEEPHSKERA